MLKRDTGDNVKMGYGVNVKKDTGVHEKNKNIPSLSTDSRLSIVTMHLSISSCSH